MKVPLRVVSGNITLRSQSGQVRVFHSPRKGGLGNKEVFLDKAATVGPAMGVVSRIGFPQIAASVSGCRPEIVGQYARQNFEIEEGEVIKVFVDTRNTLGKRFKRGSIYLRMRANAALRCIEIGLTDHASATFTKGEIEGTFDILTPEQVDAAGVKIEARNRPFSQPSVVRKLITKDTIIRPAIEELPTIVKKKLKDEVSGTSREVLEVARPKRRIGR